LTTDVAIAVTAAIGSVTTTRTSLMEQPLASVTVYVYVPAATPMKVPGAALSEPAVDVAGDTANVYPPVPPAGLTTTVVEPPVQPMSVKKALGTGVAVAVTAAVGSVTVVDAVVMQPLASVTVYVWVPAGTPANWCGALTETVKPA
jgi:hypothetical protein